MWKIKYRWLALWMALCLAITSVPTLVFASEVDLGTVTWELNEDGVLTIRGSGMAERGDWAAENVKSVVIEEGITGIGSEAFYGCRSLRSVIIPEGVESIGRYAFRECGSLESVIIPESVTSIGEFTFSNCESLRSVIIPEGVTSIGSYAFSGCESLEKLVIPGSVTNIGYGALGEYPESQLKTAGPIGGEYDIEFGWASEIPKQAFSRCRSLTEVTVPEGVESIGDSAFSGCVNLTGVTLPESITSIGEVAFSDCESLTSVIIPEGVESIGYAVFSYCVNLTSVTLPESITSIGASAFSGCRNLADITLPESVESIGDSTFYNCGSLRSVIIPEGVESIGASAFSDCESLTSVTLPESLTSIGASAFSGCGNLADITLPESVKSIGDWAFSGCGSLTSVIIPEGVESIGDWAFSNCASLEKLVIPGSVTSMGWGVLGYDQEENQENPTNRLKTAGPIGGEYDIEFGWASEIPENAFSQCRSLTEVTVPEGVESIGDNAFAGCGNLTSVTLPESLTSIGSWVFSGCGNLVGITLPESVESIEAWVFAGCGSLKSMDIPEGVTSIGAWAFAACGSLTSMDIPEGVTSLGDSAFGNCENLTSVMIPFSLESIGDDCFSNCPNLILYVIPGSYGETYAKDNNIPCEYMSSNNKIVRIRLTEEDGEPVTSGYLVKWFVGDEMVGTGNMISVMDTVQTLTYKVELEESEIFSYYQPKAQTVDIDSTDLNVTCKLRKIPSVTLTGKVTDSAGNAVPGASVMLTQMADQKHVRTKETKTDSAGAYSVEILDLPTSVEINADGYFRREITAISDPAGVDIDLGTEELLKLPENKITLRLTMAKAAPEGEEPASVSLSNGNGLEFSVYNETKGKAVSEYIAQYPYLMLGENEADENDVITISAVDTKSTMTAAPVQITLDRQKMGTAEILFVQNGFFEASLQGELPAVLMIFDASGNFVGKKTVSSAAVSSGELTEGMYQAVFMQKTSLLEGVQRLSRLAGYGLSEGKDYVLKRVEIKNGTVTGLGSVKVPKLDESLLYYTDSSSSSMTANKQSVTEGDFVMLRAEYKMKPEYAAAEGQSVVISIPDGVQFVENSVTVDGKAANYTYGNGVVTVHVNKNAGVVRCYVILEKGGEKNVSSELSFTWDGEAKTQPLGAAHIVGELMRLTVPGRTGQKSVTVTGKTIAGSEITIYDNGVEAGKTNSNAAGNWSLTFDLVHPFSYTYHDIYAAVENEKYENIIYSDTETVLYDKSYMDVSKVTMYNRGDNGENITVFDFMNPGKQGSYRMWPGRYTDFTFVIEFTGNASQVKNVVLNVFSKSGQVRSFDADYDATKNVWVVNTQFTSYNDAPVNVGVEYSRKEEEDMDYVIPSGPDAEECNREYLAAADSVLEDLVDVRIKEDTDEKLVLAFSPADGDGEAWNLEIRELDYAAFHVEELESRGFVKCEADDPVEKPQYFKMAVEESGVVFSIVDEEEKYAFSYTIPLDFLLPIEEAQGVSMLSYERSGGMSDLPDLDEAIKDALDMKMVLNGIEDCAPAGELVAAIHYQSLRKMLAEKNIDSMNRASHIQNLMATECKDGSLSLPEDIWREALKRYGDVQAADAATYNWLENDLKVYQRKIWNALAFDVATLGFGKIIKIGGGIGKTVRVLKNSKNAKYTKYVIRSKKIRDNLDDWLKAAWDTSGKVGDKIDGPVGDFFEAMDVSGIQYWEDIIEGYAKLDTLYDNLEKYIRSNMKCKVDEEPKSDGKKGPDADKEPILDPSGYVCEAVPSNRLEGVTASLYGSRDKEDLFGEPTGEQEEYLWNAEDYDQANPLLTDVNGTYMWDVPGGQWRVKYEKEGYVTAYSDWLPVPPPQTEVHAAMVSLAAPQVKTVNAYKDNVKITFTQYMDMTSVTADNVKISVDGQAVSGTVTACDAEASFADETVSYARTFMFVTDQKLSGEAEVTVESAVNYAGTQMEEPYSGRKEVTEEPKSIEAEDYIEIAYNSKEKIKVQVLPNEAAAGLTLTVKSSSPSILSAKEDRIRLGADGKAEIELSGNLPGSSEILLAVDGTDIAKSVAVRVGKIPSQEGQKNRCGKVNASIASGSVVSKGTKVELSVETEGAEIYYTLDGSCPCTTDSPSRIKYDAPIEITKETFLIAYAVKDGYEDGATAGFLYYVHEDGGKDDGKNDDDKKDDELRSDPSERNHLKQGEIFTEKDGVLQYKVIKESDGKNAGTVSVIGAKKKKSKIAVPSNITAPETKETFCVVSVAAKAFKGNKIVTQVTIGDQVETIGKEAFSGCKKLKSAILGKKVSEIEDKAFYKCQKLKKITVKSTKLKKIGKNALYGIVKSAAIKVPAKQKKHYDKMFNKKTGRKSSMKVGK